MPSEPTSSMPTFLPDPAWVDHPDSCLVCGYSLEGAPELRCPECGSPFEKKQLVLHGVMRTRSHATPLRRWLWFFCVAVGIAVAYLWPLIFMSGFGRWAVFPLLGWIALFAWLLISSPRERSGKERFIITKAGIARVQATPQKPGTSPDSIFIRWGSANAAHLQRVSKVWHRLRIGRLEDNRLLDHILDAGIRCPEDQAEMVRAAIQACLDAKGDANEPTPTLPTRDSRFDIRHS